MKLRQYVVNNLIAIDRVGNTILAGDPNETLSARSGRLRYTSRSWRVLARCLDWLQFCHAQLAIQHDIDRDEADLAVLRAAQAADDALVERETRVKE